MRQVQHQPEATSMSMFKSNISYSQSVETITYLAEIGRFYNKNSGASILNEL